MPVNLTPSIDGEDVNHFGVAIHREENSPTAHAGFPDGGPFHKRCGQARIEWILRQLYETVADATLGRGCRVDRGLSQLRGQR